MSLCLNVNWKLTFKIIAFVLILGIALNCAIPTPNAHAEVITLVAVAGVVASLLLFYGIVTIWDNAVQGDINQYFQDKIDTYIYTHSDDIPTDSDIGFVVNGGIPYVTVNNSLGAWINRFIGQWCTDNNLTEYMQSPSGIGVFVSELQFYSTSTPQNYYSTLEQALAVAGAPLEIIPYDDNTFNVQFSNGALDFYYQGNNIIHNTSFGNFNLMPRYFYLYKTNNITGYYVLSEATTNHTYKWGLHTTNSFNSITSSYSAQIPGEYTEIPQQSQDIGTSITYTGAPTTSLDDFLDQLEEELIDETYTPTFDTEYPISPVPVEETTWEDGALSFWQAVGGAITGGLSTAGQSVRSWIQSMHNQLLQYWEALLDWCDGIVGAIEGAEDGFIRGIINEITSVFSSAKSTIRSALGIWHYVVEWVRSITGPFNLFLGMAGRVSPYITLPVYASIAGLVILGIYKKFIG